MPFCIWRWVRSTRHCWASGRHLKATVFFLCSGLTVKRLKLSELTGMRFICRIRSGRPFCDSAPVLERYWAVQAGLGWIGRNHQLIIPQRGSYFFLGELLIDTELDYDRPFEHNHCGECRRCIESCPTGALDEHCFDARKCLSYLTIEHRGELPENIGEKIGNCFYGCDRCQTACPHNRFAKPNSTPELQPTDELLQMTTERWRSLTKEEYDRLFKKSAVERCGYEQLMRNIKECKKDFKK